MIRRKGREDSATRVTLIDAVETVMREDGYAALSARTISRRAGLKYQIVFYYFDTIDDLFIAAYRRRTQRIELQIDQAMDSEQPLHALWKILADPVEAALSMEYMAMSNHNTAIRRETRDHASQLRRTVMSKIEGALKLDSFNSPAVTASSVAMIVAVIANGMGFQHVQGIEDGYLEAKALVDWCLERLEPAPAPADTRERSSLT